MNELHWEKEFLDSIPTFVEAGMSEEKARKLLEKYIQLSRNLPIPAILDFSNPKSWDENSSAFLERNLEIHDLMLEILKPLLQDFTLENKDFFRKTIPYLQTTGVTIVSNHLSYFDSAVLYALLYLEEEFRSIAKNIFFISGRLVYLSNFSNVAARMFHAMLVASPRDIAENESIKKELNRLNLKSFKESKARLKNGQVLILFPEGTRSRSGELGIFHSGVFNYLDDTIVLPVALIGPDKILSTDSFTFRRTAGKMILCEPFYIGKNSDSTQNIDTINLSELQSENRKQEAMDLIGKKIASNLPESMHGYYSQS